MLVDNAVSVEHIMQKRSRGLLSTTWDCKKGRKMSNFIHFLSFCMQGLDAPAILGHQRNKYTAEKTLNTR